MAQTAEMVSVEKVGNMFRLTFAGGEGFEFNDLSEMTSWALSIQTLDTAKQLLVAWWLARNADATNTNLVTGKKLILDLSAAQPIKVQ